MRVAELGGVTGLSSRGGAEGAELEASAAGGGGGGATGYNGHKADVWAASHGMSGLNFVETAVLTGDKRILSLLADTVLKSSKPPPFSGKGKPGAPQVRGELQDILDTRFCGWCFEPIINEIPCPSGCARA